MHILLAYIRSWHLCSPFRLCFHSFSSQHIFTSLPAFFPSVGISFPVLHFILFLTSSFAPPFLVSPSLPKSSSPLLSPVFPMSSPFGSHISCPLLILHHHSFITSPLIISPPLALLPVLPHKFTPVSPPPSNPADVAAC